MRISVGSVQPVKLKAVREALQEYSLYKSAEVVGVEVGGGVREQPLSLEETLRGARERAQRGFVDCTLSIGLECGVFELPESGNHALVQVSSCVIFDGKRFGVGLSPAFELPVSVSKRLFENGCDLNEALRAEGLTDDPRIGSSIGAIGVLTRGRVTRSEAIILAITMALIPFDGSGT